MKLPKCKTCSHFNTMFNNSVVCSFDNQMSERKVLKNEEDKILENCPLDKGSEVDRKIATRESIKCEICKGSGQVDNRICFFCNGLGNIRENSDNSEVKIPHYAEFRVKAVKIGDKYKIVILKDNNNSLLAQSPELELGNDLYNQLVKDCLDKVKE